MPVSSPLEQSLPEGARRRASCYPFSRAPTADRGDLSALVPAQLGPAAAARLECPCPLAASAASEPTYAHSTEWRTKDAY